jgi:hypothetical protein
LTEQIQEDHNRLHIKYLGQAIQYFQVIIWYQEQVECWRYILILLTYLRYSQLSFTTWFMYIYYSHHLLRVNWSKQGEIWWKRVRLILINLTWKTILVLMSRKLITKLLLWYLSVAGMTIYLIDYWIIEVSGLSLI